MPLSAPEYWLEWTKNYFRCQFTHMGGLFHKKNAPESTPLWIVAFWKFNRALGGLTTAVSVFVNSTNITTNNETAALSSKYALDESFYGHFCPRRKAADFCHPGITRDETLPDWGRPDPFKGTFHFDVHQLFQSNLIFRITTRMTMNLVLILIFEIKDNLSLKRILLLFYSILFLFYPSLLLKDQTQHNQQLIVYNHFHNHSA